MVDSIGAIGVLLTMITILLTVWQPEMDEKLKIDVSQKRGNEVVIKDIKSFNNFKINILLYGSLIIFIIISFDVIMIICKVIQLCRLEGIKIIERYNSIYPIYLMLWIFSLILCRYIHSMKKSIKDKIKKLEG
ncbi:MAG: hypothetical protein GX317_01610 [Staphylococcus equorum]|nr:hypothetical protein [Staphylococcus equorum]